MFSGRESFVEINIDSWQSHIYGVGDFGIVNCKRVFLSKFYFLTTFKK